MLGELIGISNIRRAFNCIDISLSKDGTYTLGKASGLFVLRYPSGNAQHFLFLVDNYSRKITHIAGLDPNNTSAFEFLFEGSGYNTEVVIKNKSGVDNALFEIAYQSI